MRKLVWSCCLASVVAGGSLVGSACYVYKNPDSLLARWSTVALQFSMRYNPFFNGAATAVVGMATTSWNTQMAAASQDVEEYQRPEEPTAVDEPLEPVPFEELRGIVELPMPRVTAIVIEEPDAFPVVIGQEEPPLAEQPGVMQPNLIIDPAVLQASGSAVVPAIPRVMPYCKSDEEVKKTMPYACESEVEVEKPVTGCCRLESSCCKKNADCCYSSCAFFWAFKGVETCVHETRKVVETSWSGVWFSFFSTSPSMLETKGDEEVAEPKEMPEMTEPMEDPHHHYHHHSGCPHSNVCPYSGRHYTPKDYYPTPMPTPAQEEEQTEPVTPKKKKVKLPKWDDTEESENTPVHPEIDTMEFRPSDRTWNEYGGPYQL